MGGHQRAYEGETNVWLTPPEILTALGEFDLDPCAPAVRPWDTAKKHLTEEDDGLAHEWAGRVWMNPPYGPHGKVWMERLAKHGDGIALVFARTETAMFFPWVWDYADSILFLRKRLHFHRPDGSKAERNSGAPSVLVAYGKNNTDVLSRCGIEGKLVGLRDGG